MSGFWEKRRRAVEAEARAEAEAAVAKTEAEERAELESLPEAEQLERLGLPDPDSIGPGDDVAAFMRKAVPAALRNRALRRLWVSNPVLANLDGLADYADDFTGNGLKGGVLTTSYQVGKGLARHVEQMAREAEATVAEAEGDGARDVAEPNTRLEHSENDAAISDTCDKTGFDERAEPVEGSHGIPSDSDTGGGGARTRRRMAFSFEEEDSERPRPDGPGPGRA